MNGDKQRIELPASVRAQLRAFQRRLLVIETTVAVVGGLCGLLAAYALLFISDRLWDTPAWLRVALAVVCVVGFATGASFWLTRWVWRRRDDPQLAILIQRHFPRLGDRLLGIVELAKSAGDGGRSTSPALLRAAMEQVAGEASAFDFRRAAPARPARLWTTAGVVLLVVVVAGMGWLPAAGVNAWHRLVNPVAQIARYTLVRLRGLPDRLVVAYGEPFTVTASVEEGSRWLPDRGRARFEHQPAVDAPVVERAATFELPGQREPGTLAVKIGDATGRVRVQPEYRPELKELRAVIELPAYLGHPVATQTVANGSLELVVGSKLTLAGQVSRALAEASEQEAWSVERDGFRSPVLEITDGRLLTIRWSDVLGLSSREPYTLQLRARPDAAPGVDCRGLERVTAILEDEILQFEVAGEDDFGVKEIGVVWEGSGRAETGLTPTNSAWAVAQGGQQEKKVAGPVRFSPLALNLKPQKVTLRARAVDYRPGREASSSEPYTIYVLDKVEHAKLLQQQFERLLEKLEEIARTEESLFELNQQLAEKLKESGAEAALQEQERGERTNTEALRRMQEEGLKLLEEALRNKSIDEKVLAQWAELLKKLEQLAQEGMPKVAQSLAQARQQPQQREGPMNQALTQQEQVLKELSELLNQMNRANQEMAAGNFINRLMMAAGQERDIGSDLRGVVPETIGLAADKLPPLLRGRIDRLQDRQERTQQTVKHIQDDLDGFFSRTRQPLYGEVSRAMVETRVTEELGKVAVLIEQNTGGQAIEQANRWALQLEEWAKLLDDDKGDGGGGGGGGGQASAQLLELLMKLMRVRQTEEGLREQTRFLEEHKPGNAGYGESTARLGQLQHALVASVQKIGEEYPYPQVLGLLDEVEDAMTDAARFLDVPQTDKETVAAETEVIELLGKTCKKCAGGGGGGGAPNLSALSPELMAMLMRMMGEGAGRTGGGSTAGGDTERVPDTTVGPAEGAAPEERPVEKAGGRTGESLPAEFRDALEAYFQAVEELEE